MALDCVTTTYGPPAHAALAEVVGQAKDGDPLAPVTVIVPTHSVGLAARRALGRQQGNGTRGVAAVGFHTAYSLAERLGGPRLAAQKQPGVSNTVIGAAVRSVLHRNPGHFAGVESHPATERALVRAFRELSELEPSALAALARQSRRAGDVVRIHRQVAESLRDRYSTEQQLATEAIVAVRADPDRIARQLGAVLVFMPQRITRLQAELLRAVSEATDMTVIVALTGRPEADATVEASLTQLGANHDGLEHIVPGGHVIEGRNAERAEDRIEPLDGDQAGLAATDLGDPRVSTRQSIRAVSVSDADDEVRHAVRAVIDAARDGTPLGRCALLYGVENPYGRLIGDALDAAGIKRCGTSPATAATSLLGRSLLKMLELDSRQFSRRAVMDWLSASAARRPAAAWERIARSARVDKGIDSWRQRLNTYADALRLQAEQAERDDEHSHRAERLRRDAGRADELLDFVERLHSDLNPATEPGRWADLARWCQGLINRHLGARGRDDWPETEAEMAVRVEEAVARLGQLDGIDTEPSRSSFRRALQVELDVAQRVGRLGTGVLVGPVESAIGMELDLVVVCGMAEGSFPARRSDDALLPDRERLACGGQLASMADRTGDEHRALLAVISAAAQTRLLWPRGDLRQATERAPSRWLADHVNASEEVPSFVAGLRGTAFPAHLQEYDTRSLLDWHEANEPPKSRAAWFDEAADRWSRLEACPSVRQRRELRRGVELLRSRRSRELTRFDGNLRAASGWDLAFASPTEPSEVTSASRLEAWGACPYRYFVRHVLRVEPVDDPDTEHRINPLERGSLVHRVLERWLNEAIDDGAVPRSNEQWPEKWRERLAELGEQECEQLAERGLVGRARFWAHDQERILRDLDELLNVDDTRRGASDAVPVAAELGFGMPHTPNDPPVKILLNDGRSLRLRGSIDRVEDTSDGGLAVIDYKTGKASDDHKQLKNDPTAGGRLYQLVLYDLAARELLGRVDTDPGYGAYWFVSTKGDFKTVDLDTVQARAQVLQAVQTAVDGIGEGLFPLHPAEPKWMPFNPCEFCDPDDMGTRDQWRDWQRKASDPSLRDYLALCDPELAAAGSDSTDATRDAERQGHLEPAVESGDMGSVRAFRMGAQR